MKNTFRFAAIVAALLIAGSTASAQLGINVGYAPQTYKTTYSNSTDTAKMSGFFAGVNYNKNLTGDLNVSIGVQVRYNTHSDSVQASVLGGLASGQIKETSNQMTIDVPVLFNYGIRLTDDIKLSAFAGPTFTYALSGTTKYEGNMSVLGISGSSDQTMDWYKEDEGNFKAFDISGTVGLNIAYKSYRLYGGYNFGLLNLSGDDDVTRKGSNIFVGIGLSL